MDFAEYQARALGTNLKDLAAKKDIVPALFGLGSETGSVLNVYKKKLRDHLHSADAKAFLKQELGDLLWYVAIICDGVGLEMDDVAAHNLDRAARRYHEPAPDDRLPVLDAAFPEHERFPRRFTFRFEEHEEDHRPVVTTTLVSTEPSMPGKQPGRKRAMQPGDQFGQSMDDNDEILDGYRYHDVIHMGFLAGLGWSPNMRGFLGLKRKSDHVVDSDQDGARALFKEEGLAAMLAELSKDRFHFRSRLSVNGEVLRVVRAVVRGLEVEAANDFEWSNAINQGFQALHALKEHRGGLVHLDLDERTVTFEA